MSAAINVPVAAGTHLRRGVSTRGPANILATLAAGEYPAEGQCAGEEVVSASGARNYWWVKVTAQGHTGWVSGTTVLIGGNDEPIPGPPELPTVNV